MDRQLRLSPTNFAPESGAKGEDAYVVLATNSGGAASSGPVTVTDELPEGLVSMPGVIAEDELVVKKGGAGGARAGLLLVVWWWRGG